MIKGTFRIGGNLMEVIIRENELLFLDSSGQITSIEGLKLNQAGVIKEFPDLKGDSEWRKKSIERLKNHIKNLETEDKKIEYIRKELEKYGYTPLIKQRAGHRPKKFK